MMRSADALHARANEHRPKDLDEARDAARQMIRDGYGDHTIAAALQMSVEQVRRLLGPHCPGCE